MTRIRKCKDCNKHLVDEGHYKNSFYNINIGDETERKWKKNMFDLCFDCWGKKKESYKSLLGEWNEDKDKWSNRKVEIFRNKVGKGSVTTNRLLICPTCKKWTDEYEEKSKGEIFCSLKCEQNKDKRNNNDREKEQNQQTQLILSNLNQFQQYFTANNIHSITNENGNLVIIFNTNTNTNTNIIPPSQTITKEELSETSTLMEPEQKSMWKKFKEYLKKEGKNKINKQELEQEISKLKTQTEQKPKETKIWPWIIGGIGIIAVLGIVIALIRKRRLKR